MHFQAQDQLSRAQQKLQLVLGNPKRPRPESQSKAGAVEEEYWGQEGEGHLQTQNQRQEETEQIVQHKVNQGFPGICFQSSLRPQR